MTERLTIRVTLRDVPEHATAGGSRGHQSNPVRPRMGGRMGLWTVGGAVAAGLAIILAVTVLMDFPGDPSIASDVASSEARTTDGRSVESGGTPSTKTAAFQVEPAARPAVEDEDVSANKTVEAATKVETAAADTGVDNVAKALVRPAVATLKPVEKPKTAVPREEVASNPQEAVREKVTPEPQVTVDVRPTKPKTVAVAPTTRTGQRAALDQPDPAGAPAINDPRVLRAQLSAGVKGKEPTARLQPPIRVTGGSDRTIYYFSEVRDLDGQTLFHRWEREGRVLASVPFEIRGERWRVYSRKTITPRMTGTWRVVLADAGGKELASSTFSVR